MSDAIFAREIVPINLEDEMRQSYLDYSMSVIVGRALPDVRDGMKPVQRRILYAMYEMHNDWNKPFKKSARVVGDVMGKYHPHGDSSIYEAIVRMAQNFSMRYPLVNGQGNFGSVDGDGAAAMRYTEVRMHKIAHEILADIDRETVDFIPNYDNHEQEPVVLPSRIPNLLINGSSGIAVGMATNIPPHNLREVISAALALLANPELTIYELMQFIPAPDFPTGAKIFGLSGVKEGYLTGRGRVIIRGKAHFEDIRGGDRQAVVIDEIPYQVNKARLIEKIGSLIRDKIMQGIADLRDESDKSGMRIVLELKRNENAEVILNQLYKLTSLQDSFGINMIALVDGYPKQLNLKDFLAEFLKHRREVVYRRTTFELNKSRNRVHILEGLAVALANVDEIIKLIKASKTPPEAKAALTARPWRSRLVTEMLNRVEKNLSRPPAEILDLGLKTDGYHLSEVQAQAILELRLQRLTGLEQDKIIAEYNEVIDLIVDLLDILAKPPRIAAIIDAELKQIMAEFGDERKSEIDSLGGDLDDEDLIPAADMIVTLSHEGYIKTQPVTEYQAQRRGGRGKLATATKDEDFITTLFVANSHDYLLCFTSFGRCFWIKVYKLPVGGRNSRGRPVKNVLDLAAEETVSTILPVKAFTEDEYVFMSTAGGIVKKVSLMAFSHPRKLGIIAINLLPGDSLIGVVKTTGQHDIMLFSDSGKAIRFAESEIRVMGRTAGGVRGMKLTGKAKVISLLAVGQEEVLTDTVLTAVTNGYGKRTLVAQYRKSHRGNQGIIAIDTGDRNGALVAASLVAVSDDVMLITSGGVLIRTRVEQIRETGRSAQGVKLINLDAGETLVGLEKIAETTDQPATVVSE